MAAPETCSVCGDAVQGGEGITCYFCGQTFHYANARECGLVLPNPSAC